MTYLKSFYSKLAFLSVSVFILLIFYAKYNENHMYQSFYYEKEIKEDDISSIINEINEHTFNKYAIISVSILYGKDFYFFQLPAVVKSWSRIGYRTIIILVSSQIPINDQLALKTIEYLNKFDAKLVYLKSPKDYEITFSMVSRLYVSLLDSNLINEHDFLITSDSDLYPINKDYFLSDSMLETNKDCVFLWNAFCCGSFNYMNKSYTMYPMAHIGARKYQWRKMMGLNKENEFNIDIISKDVENFLLNQNLTVKQNQKIAKGDDIWYLDQHMISVRLSNYKKLHKMPYNGLRFDRAFYYGQNDTRKTLLEMIPSYGLFDAIKLMLTNYNIVKFTDFHSFQDRIYNNIALLENMFDSLFDFETNEILKRYHKEFMNLKNKIR
jgi:hypothetical protein